MSTTAPLADQTKSGNIVELGKNVNVRSLRRGSPLVCRVMCFVSSSPILGSSGVKCILYDPVLDRLNEAVMISGGPSTVC